MRIMVRTLRGDRVALDVDGATTTVAQAKGMVMARERVPVAMQRLFFAGCHLDDDERTLANYGVQHDSVLFLGLRLRAASTTPCQDEMHRLQVPAGLTAAKHEVHQEMHVHAHGHAGANGAGGEEPEKAKARKPASRRALRKILSRLHVDAWTRQHDAKLLDLLQRHAAGRGGGVGDLTGEDWSAIRAELNAATGSGFPVEELQRRGGGGRRRVVVAEEADWKWYTLENPDAAAYAGRSPRLALLRAVFAGDGRAGAGAKSRESRPRRCLNKLLRSFGLRSSH
ncbi:Ubiquitin-60S ribosomal protein L40 [Triticum urartu]|uniref:Ubiquitin-60S ribosomal protein L40 n=1 Tax=Triticum urartu TaxID=4572 RepID=M7Z813_TRIUA|nr:Ubiquitin-60S ribosomal protein L40 [Triticum urartu]